MYFVVVKQGQVQKNETRTWTFGAKILRLALVVFR